MSSEGFIKCNICHEWLEPKVVTLNWLNTGGNVCDACSEDVEAVAGWLMERIRNLNETCNHLRAREVA